MCSNREKCALSFVYQFSSFILNFFYCLPVIFFPIFYINFVFLFWVFCVYVVCFSSGLHNNLLIPKKINDTGFFFLWFFYRTALYIYLYVVSWALMLALKQKHLQTWYKTFRITDLNKSKYYNKVKANPQEAPAPQNRRATHSERWYWAKSCRRRAIWQEQRVLRQDATRPKVAEQEISIWKTFMRRLSR